MYKHHSKNNPRFRLIKGSYKCQQKAVTPVFIFHLSPHAVTFVQKQPKPWKPVKVKGKIRRMLMCGEGVVLPHPPTTLKQEQLERRKTALWIMFLLKRNWFGQSKTLHLRPQRKTFPFKLHTSLGIKQTGYFSKQRAISLKDKCNVSSPAQTGDRMPP